MHAADVFAEIVAALAAGLADAAGQRAVHHDPIAGLERRRRPAPTATISPDGLGADDERQLALGERHAAPAPDIDVVEADGLDRDLHFARAGRRRRRDSTSSSLRSATRVSARIVLVSRRGSG